jgi:hypothetical protein
MLTTARFIVCDRAAVGCTGRLWLRSRSEVDADDDGVVTRLRDQVKTSNGFEVIGQRSTPTAGAATFKMSRTKSTATARQIGRLHSPAGLDCSLPRASKRSVEAENLVAFPAALRRLDADGSARAGFANTFVLDLHRLDGQLEVRSVTDDSNSVADF